MNLQIIIQYLFWIKTDNNMKQVQSCIKGAAFLSVQSSEGNLNQEVVEPKILQ